MVFALTAVFFWSTVATAFKIGLAHYSPAQLLMVASATSSLVLLSILLLTGESTGLVNLTLKQIAVPAFLGLLNPFAYYLVLFKAYSLLPAQIAQPVNMIWPIVLVLLSVPLLKQPVSWKSILALLISFAGVVLISSKGSLNGFSETNPLGIALCLISSVIWSLYWIFNQKNKLRPATGLFINFVSGSVAMLVYMLLTRQLSLPPGKGLATGIYIGIFETGLTFWLWMKALSLTGNSAKVANLVYIAPFLSLFFIHYVVGETIYYTTIGGMVLIVAGILFQQSGKAKKGLKEFIKTKKA